MRTPSWLHASVFTIALWPGRFCERMCVTPKSRQQSNIIQSEHYSTWMNSPFGHFHCLMLFGEADANLYRDGCRTSARTDFCKGRNVGATYHRIEHFSAFFVNTCSTQYTYQIDLKTSIKTFLPLPTLTIRGALTKPCSCPQSGPIAES